MALAEYRKFILVGGDFGRRSPAVCWIAEINGDDRMLLCCPKLKRIYADILGGNSSKVSGGIAFSAQFEKDTDRLTVNSHIGACLVQSYCDQVDAILANLDVVHVQVGKVYS